MAGYRAMLQRMSSIIWGALGFDNLLSDGTAQPAANVARSDLASSRNTRAAARTGSAVSS
jgi:hypothetical protein